MRPLASLEALNELDLIVDGIKARLAEIAEAMKEPAAVRSVRVELARANPHLADLQARQRELEAAQRDAAETLAREEARLYSGRITDAKELRDKEADVAQKRRQKGQRDDELLEVLIEVEGVQAQCETAGARLAELVGKWQAAQATLLIEQGKLQRRLASEAPRHAAARAAAPAHLLSLYDHLRARRGGRAVAALEGDACSACRVAVSPNKIEAARYGDELVYCENCGRLLWAE